MICYRLYYKKMGSLFWRKLDKIKGDGIYENGFYRFFILEDETRIEIPMQNTIFKFSKERFLSIQKRMSEEAMQEVQIQKR